MREMAMALGITERSVTRLLKDLEAEGYIRWETTGKGNIYEIERSVSLKHDLTKNASVRDLLSLLDQEST
jgi:DNA-binding transcriptional regulator YhcF (GntR family)